MNDHELVQSEIAHLIGTQECDWDNKTRLDVEACIRRGIHNTIHNGTHEWSWMRPTFRFKTADGQRRYTLPLDFEEFIDCIYFDGENYQYPPLRQLPATRLMQMESAYIDEGTPCHFATENVMHDGMTEQTQQLVIHPTPDDEYPLHGIYQVGPIRKLTSDNPWFPGGPANKELFLQACLAAAESRFFDMKAEREECFQTTLANAIAGDLRRQPRNLGPLGPNGRGFRNKGDVRSALGWRLQTTIRGTDGY